MKKRKRNSYIIPALIFISVIIIIASAYEIFTKFPSSSQILNKKTIYSSFIISDHAGFDLNSTALTFGMITPGGTAKRSIILTNDFDKDIKVTIESKGNISGYLIASENEFILLKKEKKKIEFSILSPSSINSGKYDGYITFVFWEA
jgi:hypothetical protein